MERVGRKMREHGARKRQEKRTQGMILPGGGSESERGGVELTVFSVHAKKAVAFLHVQNCSVQDAGLGPFSLLQFQTRGQLPSALLSI